MKNLFKLLIISSLLITSNLVLAQDIDAANTKPYVYCQIVSSSLLFKNKLNVNIDYGQERNFLGIDLIKTDGNKKAIKFNSMIDALNYMSEQGWEFVQAYVIVEGTDSTTYWILKKRKE
jgi:hypothetical protein